jgi:hypothetical protein
MNDNWYSIETFESNNFISIFDSNTGRNTILNKNQITYIETKKEDKQYIIIVELSTGATKSFYMDDNKFEEFISNFGLKLKGNEDND